MPSNGIQTQMSSSMLVETMCSHLFCGIPHGTGTHVGALQRRSFSPPVAACSTKKRVGVATWVLVVACPQLMHTHGCLVFCSAVIPLLRGHSPNTTPAESPPQPSRGVGTPGTTLWLGRLGHKGCPQVAWCPTGPTAWPTGLLPKGLAIKL